MALAKLPPMDRDEFLARPMRPPADVMAYTGLTEHAVYQLVKDGTFPSVRVGRAWRVSTRGVVKVVDGESSPAASA